MAKLTMCRVIMITGTGANTVCIEGEVKHITELDALTLTHEWSKLKTENSYLYSYNHRVNKGWRGFVLRLMGVHLPEKEGAHHQGINARKESMYPDDAMRDQFEKARIARQGGKANMVMVEQDFNKLNSSD